MLPEHYFTGRVKQDTESKVDLHLYRVIDRSGKFQS